ncbi:MAG: metallophosphatase family protein [Proteobacteria bacterium]|nr:metallophosphatase family protein [Pseudomonadota bacterium]MBU4471684.1 metallophosphatase family protein [Pseudomonadota bacterium]MCG2750659.1 metallophosphatase family protein [Desulfobacteraceae bacterium]
MRIGLISDTHIPDVEDIIPGEIAHFFRGVDLILHAGDIYRSRVLDDLERIAPVLAARGDDDDGDIGLDRRVKNKHILKIEGQTIWLVHERPFELRFPDMPQSLKFPPLKYKKGEEPKIEPPPDIYIFGHEHCTVMEQVENTLYVNPGSPTYLHYKRGLGTVAILDINLGIAEVRFIEL